MNPRVATRGFTKRPAIIEQYNARMRIFVACPAPPGSRRGNRVTALRWARLLRQLGQRVRIGERWRGRPPDLLIALHARKSHAAIARFRAQAPERPVVLCLTGTDLYQDLKTSAAARQSLDWADRVVVLHPKAKDDLPAAVHDKLRVIHQSLPAPRSSPKKREGRFEVCVLAHLRDVKDPLRAGLALRHVPTSVPLRVIHAGMALTPEWAQRARRLMQREPRYRWLGETSPARARRLLARSHALVVSSRLEGGANVVSEAIVHGVPVLASRIAGNLGLLGDDYPAYYPVLDSAALAELMRRAATEASFYDDLVRRVRRLAPQFRPEREREAWRGLLSELT
jgi:putative glycosyltransferase (TIGR04348 family)